MAIQLENKGKSEKKKNFWLNHVQQVHFSISEMGQVADYLNQNESIITNCIDSIRVLGEKNLNTLLRIHERFDESQCLITHQAKQLFDSIFQGCQFSDTLKQIESMVEDWANFTKKFNGQLKMLNHNVMPQLSSQNGPLVNTVRVVREIEREGKPLQQMAKPHIEFLSKNYRVFESVIQYLDNIKPFFELPKQYRDNMKCLAEMQNTFGDISDAIHLLQPPKLPDILRARDENHIWSVQTIPLPYYPPNRVITEREFYSRFEGFLGDFGESVKEMTLAQMREKGFSEAGIRQRISSPTPSSMKSELKLFPLGATPLKDLQVILIVEESGKKMIRFFSPREGELTMTLAEARFSHRRNEDKPLKIWLDLYKLVSKRGKPVHLRKLRVSLLNKELMRILQTQDRPIRCVGTGLYRPIFQCRISR